MKRRAILALAGMVWAPMALSGDRRESGRASETFAPADWPALRKGLVGHPTIVHLWGVTCAPCVDELPRWTRFADRRPAARIVFVHLDTVPHDLADRALQRAGFVRGRSLVLRGIADEGLRYRIDPRWGGELPRTLLLDAAGNISHSFSGSADFGALERWVKSGRLR